MKSFAYPLAILMVACVASAASAGATEDLHQIKARMEANVAEKKQLRAVNVSPADAREYQDMQKLVREDAPPPALLAKIQLATQAYQNTDSVTREAKMVRVLKAPDGSQAPARGTAIGGAIGSHANDGDED